MKGHDFAHGHPRWVGVVGLILAALLLFYFPNLKTVSGILVLVVLLHVAGFLVLGGSVYAFAPRYIARLAERLRRHVHGEDAGYRFGWSMGWMNFYWIACVAAATLAVVLQVSYPGAWPLTFILLLLSANFLAGNVYIRSSKKPEYVVLPMVDLLPGESRTVLDAGCGSGRSCIAIGKSMRNIDLTAVDRFDAAYIEDGGRALLERNLKLAGMADRVRIEQGDLTALPFAEGSFDAIVSAHVMDHLGDAKEKGLAEISRVLKPGGRFLMLVWTPGWPMFAVANVLCFFLESKSWWRRAAASAGFAVRDEGLFNGAWYVLFEK
jgi:SAM-dependent methyltransferase